MNAYITRIIVGLAIIAVGIGFLLDNLNIIEFSRLANDWWPLAVIFAGILIFMNDTKSYVWALIVVGVGIVFQLRELGVADINPWQLLGPLIVIAIGVSILTRRGPHQRLTKAERDDVTAILGGAEQKSASEDFKGGKVTVVMGGAKIDLRKATIKKEASIDIFNFWGGLEIVVPRNVIVRNQTSAILGGLEDKTDQETDKTSPVLYVTGDVIMAGVEIKN